MKSAVAEGNKHSVEFMLSEYERIQSLIFDEIRQCEQRVSFFMTITSAVGGVILLFSQVSTLATDVIVMVSEGVLVTLFIYGMITQNRVSQRNVNLTMYRRLQEDIQMYFARNDPEVGAYVRSLRGAYSVEHRSKLQVKFLKWFRGTLQDLMILTNSLLCAGIISVALLTTNLPLQAVAGCTVVTAIGAVMLIRRYHYYMRSKLPPME